MKKKKHKPQILYWIEYIGFLAMYKILRALSFRAALKLCAFFFWVFYVVDFHSRHLTISHLLHAKVAKNRREAKEIAWKFYMQFSKLLTEIFKMDQVYDPNKIRIVGDEETIKKITSPDGVAQSSTNIIIVSAHYGNWEMAGAICPARSNRDMLSVMKPFGNPMVGELIMRNRRQKHLELLSKTTYGIAFKLIRELHAGKNVGLLIDQHVTEREGVDNVFFGQPCRTMKLPALLHLKTGVPLIPGVARRIGDDFSFELVVAPMIQYKPTGDQAHDIKEICQLCTTALEKLIIQQPEQWLWMHRRWTNINRKHHPHR